MDYLPNETRTLAAPDCPACLDTGIVPRDGSPRVLTGDWCTVAELAAKFEPCALCLEGELETARRAGGQYEAV